MADEEDQTNTMKHDIKTKVKDEPDSFTKTELRMMKNSRKRQANNYKVDIIINPAGNDTDEIIEKPEDLKKFILRNLGDKHYYCLICNNFNNKLLTNTNTHVESNHFPNLFSYHCLECGKACPSMNSYTNHQSITHGKNSWVSKGGIIKSISKTRTRSQIRTRSKEIGKMFACDKCDFKSDKEKQLSIHVKIKHEGARFVCKYCDHLTANSKFMDRHVNKRHGYKQQKEYEDIKAEKDGFKDEYNGYYLETKENLKSDSQFHFKCKECDYRSNRNNNLTLHMKRMHESYSNDFKCNSCPYETVDRSNLWHHIRTYHKDVFEKTKKTARSITSEEGLPKHKFTMKNSKPCLIIDGHVLLLNKYFTGLEGNKYAYFYCEHRKQKCKASAKVKVEEMKGDIHESREGMKLVLFSGEHTGHGKDEGIEVEKVFKRRRKSLFPRKSGSQIHLVLFIQKAGEKDQSNIITRENVFVEKNPEASSGGYDIKEPSDLKQFVKKDQNDQKYHCILCTESSEESITNTRDHIEAIHFQTMFTYFCERCGKKFSSQKKMVTHLSKEHGYHLTEASSDDNLKCDLCGHLSSTGFALYVHRGNAHDVKEFSCEKCDTLTMRTLAELIKHDKKIHDELKSYQCSYCDHSTVSYSKSKSHIEAVHENVCYPCDQCDKYFKSSYSLKMHKETDHKGLLLKCPHCFYVSKQKGHYKHHIKSMHLGQLSICNDCEQEFNSANAVKIHKLSGQCGEKTRAVKCNECSFVSRDKLHLKTHIDTLHLGLPYRCDVCDYEHEYPHVLKEHKKQEHPTETKAHKRKTGKVRERRKVTRNPEYSTDIDQSIQEPSDLRKFIDQNKTDKNYFCTLCKSCSYKSLISVRVHVEEVHFPNIFIYQCNKCEETFPNHKSLINHKNCKHHSSSNSSRKRREHREKTGMARTATNIKVTRNTTDDHAKNIQTPEELRQFIRKGERGELFCGLCNKKLLNTSLAHLEAIHFPNLFNYHCDQCSHTFPSKLRFNYHKKTKHDTRKKDQLRISEIKKCFEKEIESKN